MACRAIGSKVAFNGSSEIGQPYLLEEGFHFAGLNLGQVEYVVDQVEQVVIGGMDGPGVADLHIRERTVGVVGQELRENQRAVQRRAQLMRHVCEKLRLELVGACQCLGIDLQLLLRDEQFLLLPLQVVAVLLQLHVRLLEFRLLLLQLLL